LSEALSQQRERPSGIKPAPPQRFWAPDSRGRARASAGSGRPPKRWPMRPTRKDSPHVSCGPQVSAQGQEAGVWRVPHLLQGEQGGLLQELGHPQEGRLPPTPCWMSAEPSLAAGTAQRGGSTRHGCVPAGQGQRDEGQGVCSSPGNPDCARRLEHPDPSPTPAAFKASSKRPHGRLSRVEPRPAACSLIPRHPEEQEENRRP
ncbi:unnamed protein product, partial [Rangifer tarandus platyrhynchus]